MGPKVTTVITAYNHEKFIAQAIESALAQIGDFDHEILVSDDCSTDGTRDTVREYAAKYPSIVKDISSETNLGISGNLRKCFNAATGKYLAILEADDYWTSEHKLARQVKFLEEHSDASMVFNRIQLLKNGKHELLPRHENLPEKMYLNDLLAVQDLNPICNFSCCLFRTKYLLLLPDAAYEGRLSEVTVAFFMIVLGALGFIKECLSDYRIHENGVYAGAGRTEQIRQALQTFRTTRKLCHYEAFAHIDNVIRALQGAAIEEVKKGKGESAVPLFSIVTITYNNLAGLKRTAASVQRQSYANYEWIVIDGASSDGTREYLHELKDERILTSSEKDRGIYDAMNKGVRRAKGAYIICMNAGDEFREADTLQKVAQNELYADVVYGDWVRKYAEREEFCASPHELPPFYFFMNGCNICQQAMFVRTEVLQASEFDATYRIVADWAKWRELMLKGATFQYVPVTVCNFEAGTGVSERPTAYSAVDTFRLRNDFPDGVLLQADKLQEFLKAKDSAYEKELAEVRSAYDEMRTSACWRMTKPIRWTLDKLKGLVRK